MKRSLAVTAFILLALGTMSFAFRAEAATLFSRILNLKVLNKMQVGTNTETNSVTHILFGTQVAMFYTDGGQGCTLPGDAGVATITGAQVGDHCHVTMPALSHPGSKVDCSVLVADTAQLRHCALQDNVDAGQLTYAIEVISNQ